MDDLRNVFKMVLFLNFYYLHCTCIRKSKTSLKDEINEAIVQSKPND